ncbi:hypothetical protein ODZ84_09905 [Chryseobacterium fluminis]|uniref:hypothetical protein n=1 Tax=Chryseobacterium fluminis TaxID=2983606 RepID=UPI00224EA206|nr:hypothetical protein [Chryseobacterium sp. MMS21-Ot14]UZT99846.1 hypothetical protein ODZ84_09905 [Chryseobacterium sp. MMS21-Ot14]
MSATFSLLNGDGKNPFSHIDFIQFAPTDWVFNFLTNSVYWNNNATSQATSDPFEKYLGKTGNYISAYGIVSLFANGRYSVNFELQDMLSSLPDLNQAINASLFKGDLYAGATISSPSDARGKTQMQMMVSENPLIQEAALGMLTSGTGNVISRSVRTYSVYQGLEEGIVRYVGITSRSPATRFAEHIANGGERSLLRFETIEGASGLTRRQARIMEQNLINQYELQKNGGQLLNKINSIAPKNWWKFGIEK